MSLECALAAAMWRWRHVKRGCYWWKYDSSLSNCVVTVFQCKRMWWVLILCNCLVISRYQFVKNSCCCSNSIYLPGNLLYSGTMQLVLDFQFNNSQCFTWPPLENVVSYHNMGIYDWIPGILFPNECVELFVIRNISYRRFTFSGS